MRYLLDTCRVRAVIDTNVLLPENISRRLASGGQRNFLFASCHLNDQAAMIFRQLLAGV